MTARPDRVHAGFFQGDALGLLESVQGLADLAATCWAWSLRPSTRNTCAIRNVAATASGSRAFSAPNAARSAAIQAASVSSSLAIRTAFQQVSGGRGIRTHEEAHAP